MWNKERERVRSYKKKQQRKKHPEPHSRPGGGNNVPQSCLSSIKKPTEEDPYSCSTLYFGPQCTCLRISF